ncbi:multicopper oxidase [Parathielavia hyrcaniae]|uniref:Multicopper oxidase n=1 Tax=Parathielavia hyrcaniae TaxID=113614 RepID=A0AAN6PWH3_9PEZI|nr:multicopper oxidase [Parathielavia hyrcaniae]
MKLASVWTSIVQVFNVLTFSSPEELPQAAAQIPFVPSDETPFAPGHASDIPFAHGDEILVDFEPGPIVPVVQTDSGKFFHNGRPLIQEYHSGMVYHPDDYKTVPLRMDVGELEFAARFPDKPVVGTPKSPQEGAGRGLVCDYSNSAKLAGWRSCHTPTSRWCWLTNGTHYIDFRTDYEDPAKVPMGTVRQYHLEVSEQPISPDGTTMEHGKIFNRMYPGPWIEACWGDIIEITVKNNLRWNGTSVHWHGIRQYRSFQHDGVNGITECPIAPGDTFTYRFRALQYGSAWYHSHYSLQYGDGLLGPITVYGPSTANFDEDEAFRPLLLTDWSHRSVFEDWPLMLESGAAPSMTNILINGTGQFGYYKTPEKYTLYLKPRKSHMMILVNTAVDTTFVFSIDNHWLKVIAMDFVPIRPYYTDHIKIGIGQRYHVVVEGLVNPYEEERYGNYWMRAVPARKCSKFTWGPDEQMGIVRYNWTYMTAARRPAPLSEPPLYDINCADEPYDKLVPNIPWTVGDPANIDPKLTWDQIDKGALPNNTKYVFNVGMVKSGGNASFPYNGPYMPDDKQYSRWDMHTAPFRVNFSDPTLLAVDRLEDLVKQPHLDVITLDNYRHDQWIWMVITAPDKVPVSGGKSFFPAAHPMHLHGHDFALLHQSDVNWYNDSDIDHIGERWKFQPGDLNCRNPLIKCDNPPRRDVVLLPASGFVIIAFKADNPGAWIIHCHIAFHASSGLGLQIIENKQEFDKILEDDKPAIVEACEKWKHWHGNEKNHWDWHHPSHFQDDSGV